MTAYVSMIARGAAATSVSLTGVGSARTFPTMAEFDRLASEHTVVPVWAEYPAHGLTPADAYERVSEPGRRFLLEGVSQEPGASRYSYVSAGVREVIFTGNGQRDGDTDPITLLRRRIYSERVARPEGAPEFCAGAAGYVAYEAARWIEPSIAPLAPDPTGVAESAFIVPDSLVVFDSARDVVSVVALADTLCTGGWAVARQDAEGRLRNVATRLFNAPPQPEAETGTRGAPGQAAARYVTSRDEYEEMVRKAQQAVLEGELIQVVVSQRIERQTRARPLDIYRSLRGLNPSPYMFLFDFEAPGTTGGFQIIGASPELMVRVKDGSASIHPIAGTRKRGPTPDADAMLERQLRASEKERAEHIMLVDLARNDLGRVCDPGSVTVPSLMGVERYSHVMHLVSRVTGRLRKGCDALDAFRAGFPAGTLTGAPKVRAMKLVSELERDGRGPYCGAAGWFSANGDMDTGTVIRSVVLKDGLAHLQAGGGIVMESTPEDEYQESLQKMSALIRAIEHAEEDMG